MRRIKNRLSEVLFCTAIVAAGAAPAEASTRPPEPGELFFRSLFLSSAQELSDDILEGPEGMPLRNAVLNWRRASSAAASRRPDLPLDLPLDEISSISSSSTLLAVQNQRRSVLELASNDGLRRFFFDQREWDEARDGALRKAVADPQLKRQYVLIFPPPDLTVSPADIKVQDKKTLQTQALPEFLDQLTN